MKEVKERNLEKANANREDYKENRSEGFIRNYRAKRHKHLPKYRKTKLRNIHVTNIKRPLKFTDVNNNMDDLNMDNSK